MNKVLPPVLLKQICQVTQEIPTPALESLLQVLITVEPKSLGQTKPKLLQLFPKASWRQVTSQLIDDWQAQADWVDGKSMAIALSTAAYCQSQLREEFSSELVWTGPNPGSLPLRRTDQALLQLIHDAQQELLVVSFAIYNVPEIVQALLAAVGRGVKVCIVAETPEASQGKISYGLESAFGLEILERAQVYIWQREKRPVDEQGRSGSLHAKCAVADGRDLFISSANLTEYAMSLNIEMGVLIHNQELAQQVNEQINRLITYSVLTKWSKSGVHR